MQFQTAVCRNRTCQDCRGTLKMNVRYIFIVVLCLVAAVKCDVPEEDVSSKTFAEETTDIPDDARVLEKRNVPLLATNPDGSVQENGIGLKSIFIQIIGGVVKGLLNSKGISTEQIDQAVNLFNPQKIYNDLQLLRRGLNLLLRLLSVLQRYFPTSSSGFALNPLNLFKSKISFYAVQPVTNSSQLSLNDGSPIMIPKIPDRIQNIVDFVSQIPAGSDSAQSAPTIGVESGSDSSNEASIATDSPMAVVDVQTATPVPTENKNGNSGEERMTQLLQQYGLPSVSPDDSSTNIHLPIPVYGIPLASRGNFSTGQSKNQEVPLTNSANRFKEPSPQDDKAVPQQKYGVPAYPGRTRDKSGLPYERRSRFLDNEVNSGDENHSTKKGDLSNYGSIADLPLEKDTVFDRSKDSFGAPVTK